MNGNGAQHLSPPGEPRKVEARFYSYDADEAPAFVVIDDAVYKIADGQEDLAVLLRHQDVRAQLAASKESAVFFTEFEQLTEHIDRMCLEILEEQLVSYLPNHEAEVRHVLSFGEYPLPCEKQYPGVLVSSGSD